jgi:hypothetical protein
MYFNLPNIINPMHSSYLSVVIFHSFKYYENLQVDYNSPVVKLALWKILNGSVTTLLFQTHSPSLPDVLLGFLGKFCICVNQTNYLDSNNKLIYRIKYDY